MKLMKAIRRFTVRTVLPENLKSLDTLAHNLRWCWHKETEQFFASLDPQAWEKTGHDPVALLGEISPERFEQLSADPEVLARAQELTQDLEQYLTQPKWFQTEYRADHKPQSIAYFSAEFGLTSVMPQYSGGLGILAGDHLKSASDLGVPIVGVGLLYRAGYFSQSLSRDGWQRENYPLVDPHNMPLTLLKEPDGRAALISLPLPGSRLLFSQIWVAQVGRVPLLLLDSNVQENDEAARKVTDRLYGGSVEHRLEQELLLGIGGVKALRAYSRITGAPTPEVYHCNEGHAGFLSLERVHELLEADSSLSFGAAIEVVRTGNLFTTHTPVPAGIDRFSRETVRHYLSAMPLPGVDVEEILNLGSENYTGGNPEVFNMAALGLRMARQANGVSKLHGQVSRSMFAPLWPGFDEEEVPITSVTNGVHGPTWQNLAVTRLAKQYFTPEQIDSGQGWLLSEENGGMPAKELWSLRHQLRSKLVADARRRVRESWLERGASPAELGWTENILDPDILTIGFARRVPTYKRLTLMLSDPERLTRLLTDPKYPIQIVVAGKSHPDDEPGVSLIQKFVQFSDNPLVRDRIVFLPNYDMGMAEVLMSGCDVWLNNPLRPLEASGTSGMKCAMNGALNLSILDGWWDEKFDGQNGWAIPTADGVEDPHRRDQIEADALYDLLETRVVPRFYERDNLGVPQRWIEMMRHTLATLVPQLQATRMVREYVENLYTPVAKAARQLANSPYVQAQELADWKAKMRLAWGGLHVDFVEAGIANVAEVGQLVPIMAHISLNRLSPEDIQVQAVAGKIGLDDQIDFQQVVELQAKTQLPDGRWEYQGSLRLQISGAVGIAVRAVPHNQLMATAAELGLVSIAEPNEADSRTYTHWGN